MNEQQSQDLAQDGLATIAEAMAFLRLSRAKIYDMMDRGVLPSAKIDGCRRIPWRALHDLVARSMLGN